MSENPASQSRPYLEDDLKSLKVPQLREIIFKDFDKWPGRSKSSVNTATKAVLKEAILAEANGFRTTEPYPDLPQAGQTTFQSVGPASFPQSATPVPAPTTTHTPTASVLAPSPPLPPLLPPGPLALSELSMGYNGTINPGQLSLRPLRITVFVQDTRQTNARYRQQATELTLSGHPDPLNPLAIRLYTRNLISELQKTNAKITGSSLVSISLRNEQSHEFWSTFAEDLDPTSFDSYPFNPETLASPHSGYMVLAVNNPLSMTDVVPASASGPSEEVEHTSSGPRNRPSEVIGYLRCEIEKDSKLVDALKRASTRQQNPTVVEDWKAAVAFYRKYSKERLTSPSSNKKRKITKTDIAVALNKSDSWLDDAIVAVDIMLDFESSSEVQTVLETVGETPMGKGKLLEFLKAYRDEHEVNKARISKS